MEIKNPEECLKFLLICIEHGTLTSDFGEVAKVTGYKSSKFSKQAYTSILKKWGGDQDVACRSRKKAETSSKQATSAEKPTAAPKRKVEADDDTKGKRHKGKTQSSVMKREQSEGSEDDMGADAKEREDDVTNKVAFSSG